MKTRSTSILTIALLGAAASMSFAQSVAPDTKDKLYQSKGDQKRSYTFPGLNKVIPYRIYVPSSWTPGTHLPLVVVLHGAGLDNNAPFIRTPAPQKDEVQKLAEEFNFIIVSPEGYGTGYGGPRPTGGMPGPRSDNSQAPLPGAVGSAAPIPGAPRPEGPPGANGPAGLGRPDPALMQYSEPDVMNVITLMEKEYGVDTSLEFITGNSMGGIGTTHIAQAHPGKFVAMAPSEGGYQLSQFGEPAIKVKGALFIHKTFDGAPEVETDTATMVKHLRDQGVEAYMVSVPNTVHENVWFYALPTTFHFFDKYVQQARTSTPH